MGYFGLQHTIKLGYFHHGSDGSATSDKRPRGYNKRVSFYDLILMRAKSSPKINEEQDIDCARSTFHSDELSQQLNDEALDSQQELPSEEVGARRSSIATLTDQSQSSFSEEKNEAAGIARAIQLLELEDDEKITSTHSTWFITNVMSQGRMILTNKAVYFHANLPYFSAETIKAGILKMKHKGTLHSSYSKFWFMLRQDSFSYSSSSTDGINAIGTIALMDARYARISEKDTRVFLLVTESRDYQFKADNSNSANDWCKKLTREIFRLRNSGNYVRVRIPLPNITEVDRTIVIPETAFELLAIGAMPGINTPPRRYIFGIFHDAKQTIDTFKGWLRQVQEAQGYVFNSDGSVNMEKTGMHQVSESVEDTTYHVPLEDSPYAKQDLEQRLGAAGAHSESIFHEDSPAITPEALTPFASPPVQSPTISRNSSTTHVPVLGTLNKAIKSVVPDSLSTELPHSKNSVSDSNSPKTCSSRESSHTGGDRLGSTLCSITKSIGEQSPHIHTPKLLDLPEIRRTESHNHLEELDVSSDEFRSTFGFSQYVQLIQGYMCYVYRNHSPYFGRLFVSDEYLCFQRLTNSGRVPSEGHEQLLIIPWKDVENMQQAPTGTVSRQGYYGIDVSLGNAETFQIQFRSKRKALSFLSSGKEANDFRRVKQFEFMGTFPNEEQDTLYAIRVARLNTYEQAVSRRMNIKIPPVLLDPSVKAVREPFLSQPLSKLKIAMLTIGSRGDVQPYIALAQGLIAEGHSCRICTHTEYKEWIESYGIEFGEIAGDPKALMEIMIEHGSFSYAFLKEASQKFTGWLNELLKSAWEACQGVELLIESPSAMAGLHIAEALKIPYYRAFTMPWTRTRAYPHAFIVPDQKHSGSYNYMTYVLFEKMLWLGIGSHVNSWRKNTLKLPSTSLQQMREQNVPFLYCVSPSILPPTMDQPDWVHYTGYWNIKSEKSNFTPDKELDEFIRNARRDNVPLVYIGFGSIVVQNPAAMSMAIIKGVQRAKVRAVLAKGWSARGSKATDDTEFPPDIFRIDQCPHDWLFPQMDVVVHHGGSGTTGMSLSCGITTIIKPFFGDQNFYSHRVEDLGVGIRLQKLNAFSLSNALSEAVNNQEMRVRAKSLGESISHERGVATAIAAIYQELPYASTRAGNPIYDSSACTDESDLDKEERALEHIAMKKGGFSKSWTFPALWNTIKSATSSSHVSPNVSPTLVAQPTRDYVTPLNSENSS